VKVIAIGSTKLHTGDQMLGILDPGRADLRSLLLAEKAS
jgi:hypothetical protein